MNIFDKINTYEQWLAWPIHSVFRDEINRNVYGAEKIAKVAYNDFVYDMWLDDKNRREYEKEKNK